MGITFTSVKAVGRTVVADCVRNTPLRLRITVTGTASRGNETFDVDIYDCDTGPDVLLQSTVGFRVEKKGKFRVDYMESLSCTGCCEVQGGLDDSGESITEVYAYAREVGGGGAVESSNTVQLECFNSTLVSIDPKGFHSDQRLALNTTGKFAKGADKVAVDFNPVAPPLTFFPDELDSDIRMIAIGDEDLHFPEVVHAQWRLSRKELRRLTEFEGALVAYDAATKNWQPIAEMTVKGNVVTFPLRRGGLFGLVSNARYRITSMQSPIGLPSFPQQKGGTAPAVRRAATLLQATELTGAR